MKTKLFSFLLSLLLISNGIFSQKENNSFQINHSAEFDNQEDLPLNQTITFENGDILLSYSKGQKLKKVGLQLFSSALQLKTSAVPNIKALFKNKKSYFDRIISMKNKTYFFVREVYKDTKTEGMSAVEFSGSSLEIKGSPVKLFESSRGIINSNYGYSARLSNDKSKLFYKYNLFHKEKKDLLNKQEFGFFMFDENMKKLWGGEFQMPYTEARMSTIDYEVSNDGKLYFLIKVLDTDQKNSSSHFEILVYEGDKKESKSIKLETGDVEPRTTYLYEDPNNNIVVAGFYSKKGNPSIDGAFMVKLDVATGKFKKFGNSFYEIPSDLIKTYMSDREKEKVEKKEKKNEGNDKKDLGIYNLQIKEISFLDDGSAIIISEIYFTVEHIHYNGKTTTYTYDTYAEDLFIFNIDPSGNLAWIKKIPKRQHEGGIGGVGISIASMIKNNHIYIFYLDNLGNFTLPENEAPKIHQSRMGGFIAAVDISPKGEINKSNLGPADKYETNFYLKQFVESKNHNLVGVERKKKKNMLFSLEVHP